MFTRALARNAPALIELGGVMAGRVVAALGGAALSIFIARSTGAEGLGRFTLTLGILILLVLVTCFGIEACLLRTVARRRAQDRSEDIHGLLRYSLSRTAASAIGLSLILGLAIVLWMRGADDSLILPLLALGILPLCMITVVTGYLKGLRKASMAALLEIGGLSFPAAAILAAALAFSGALSIREIGWIFLAVIYTAATVAVLWSLRHASALRGGLPAVRLDVTARAELASGQAHFFTVAAATFLTQAGSFVIVAPFLTEEAIGLARAAERLALLISFAVSAVNPFIAPRIVHHVATGRPAELRTLLLKACGVSAGLSFPVALALLIAPHTVLQLFGDGFASAAPLLRIFAIGQLAVAVSGPLTMLLNMSGQEAKLMRIMIGTLLASLIVLPLAALTFGAVGFVTGYAVVLFARSFVLLHAARASLVSRPDLTADAFKHVRPCS